MTALAVMIIAFVPAEVWAQAAPPPQPVLKRSQPVWVGFAVMFFLMALVLGVSLLSSKRSHQD